MRGSTNKSPTKLNAVENKFDMGDKTLQGEFKITTPKNSLLSKQVVINKRNPST